MRMFPGKCAKILTLLLANNSTTMVKDKKNTSRMKKDVLVDGMMSFGQLDNGIRVADFACTEYVEMEAYTAKCKVQVMRSGDVYVTELPKHVRNKPLLREDNSTLSLGRDGKYYFRFTLPEELHDELPETLCREAWLISRKFINEKLCARKGGR